MWRIFFFIRVSCRLGIPSQWKSLTVFKKWLQFITAIFPALCLALFCFHPCSVCFVFLLHSRAEFELSYIHVFHFSWVLKKDWLISLMSHAERLHLLYNNSTEVSCTCPNIMTVSCGKIEVGLWKLLQVLVCSQHPVGGMRVLKRTSIDCLGT